MMSIETIRAMSRKAAARAAKLRQVPLMVESEDLADLEKHMTKNIPYIGDYRPRGYKMVERLFVDSSGFGAEYEPAMTQSAFFEKVRTLGAGHAYAVIEAGQFQVYVGVFCKVGEGKKVKKVH